ncbi:sensor histidine kinase [Listeria costaricensis]|uniref:sensor histidine kinase n=1 Tax=Listeria costaricensis TaxID=2026604 RepID=UPI000C087EBD|nr:sensor histidine kinase [Listeria costaricensis]
MDLLRYLKDKRFFLLFFFTLMFFVGLLITIDPNSRLSLDNFIYLFLFMFLFLIFYLILGFSFKYQYWKEMRELVDGEIEENIIELLPKPRTNEQAFFNELMRKKHVEEQKTISQLQDKQQEYHDFILYWVHEVKTPIVASKMLIQNPDLNDSQTIFQQVDQELDQIDKLVMQALYFSRLDTFAKDYFIQEQNLGAIVRESVKRHSKLFISRKMRIALENVDVDVRTDSKWLGFILDQLISNALKYSEPGSEIKIWCEKTPQERLDLHIEDHGRGIAPEDLPRVFEQGFTGAIGRKEKKATGMGLYLAKQMAGKLSHSMRIASVEGEGTVVTVQFESLENYLLVAKDHN